jgi:regulator of replication initiation timing|tara:strand:+ start:553 stop:873 length:321 start_codon:yes stop_codon:yes gene_type:complete
MENITNDEYIKSLIKLEEHLYQKFREIQEIKHDVIKQMVLSTDVRCENCKIKIRRVKNSFFQDHLCETCIRCSDVEKKNRNNIFGIVNGKWKKIKYLNNGWWYNKI